MASGTISASSRRLKRTMSRILYRAKCLCKMPAMTEKARADQFLVQEETWARRGLTRASRAWGTASLSGRPRDYQRMESAHRAVHRHYSRPAAHQELAPPAAVAELEPL